MLNGFANTRFTDHYTNALLYSTPSKLIPSRLYYFFLNSRCLYNNMIMNKLLYNNV